MGRRPISFWWMFSATAMVFISVASSSPDYADALSKSILFFEGQRSGKLPSTQRMIWRKDSALLDGHQIGVVRPNIKQFNLLHTPGLFFRLDEKLNMDPSAALVMVGLTDSTVQQVDLIGGYYDAGDNVKFNFPMAFSTTMLAWGVLEFGDFMGEDLKHALQAIRWATDYLLKATSVPGLVFAQVGDPYADHNCWERPEDMDTPRNPYAVSKQYPGSEVSAEIAAAFAASSIVFKTHNSHYSIMLLKRAEMVFTFADTYQGSYNESLGPWVCPFYCDYSGYHDELLWGAAWLHKATNSKFYWNYVMKNIHNLESNLVQNEDNAYGGGRFAEFGWDTKNAGFNVLVSKLVMFTTDNSATFRSNANKFVCSVLPESPMKAVEYSPGGLLFKSGGSNMQHATALSFLLVVYARYLNQAREVIHCGDIVASPSRLIQVAKSQVDYILGQNPLNMSYMVGYGKRFPQRIHHRASSIPSINQHPQQINCTGGSAYYSSNKPNPNLLTGAVVGGPDVNDSYTDSRANFVQSEPTTYINAPLVGLLAYFKSNPM